MTGASFLQGTVGAALRRAVMNSEKVSGSDRSSIPSFLSGGMSDGGRYGPQSGEIAGILKQLMDETSVDLQTLEKEELDQKTNYTGLFGLFGLFGFIGFCFGLCFGLVGPFWPFWPFWPFVLPFWPWPFGFFLALRGLLFFFEDFCGAGWALQGLAFWTLGLVVFSRHKKSLRKGLKAKENCLGHFAFFGGVKWRPETLRRHPRPWRHPDGVERPGQSSQTRQC